MRVSKKSMSSISFPPQLNQAVPDMLKKILGKTGENIWMEAPFHCDYGWNIEIGENFFANYNLTILDWRKCCNPSGRYDRR